LTAIIPEAGVTDKSSTTRTGAAETGATVWLVDDAITVTDGLHAGTFDVATGIGTATGKFNGSLDFEQTPLYAVYPAVSAMNGFTAPVVISTMQNARTAGANNIMTARCEESTASESQFVFRKGRHGAALVRLHLEGKYASKRSIPSRLRPRHKFRRCMRLRPDRSRRSAPGSSTASPTRSTKPRRWPINQFTIGLAPATTQAANTLSRQHGPLHVSFQQTARPVQSGRKRHLRFAADQFTATDSETPRKEKSRSPTNSRRSTSAHGNGQLLSSTRGGAVSMRP
ncbi:MAG: hypothetical protein ACLT1W_06905, partial [Alistipes onderdonkii]